MAAVELTGIAPAGVVRPGFVVLGASNVSRGLSRLVAAIEARAASADLFVAAGHGRSYGANSRVWARRLPSILRCGLWRGLDRAGHVAGATHVAGAGHALPDGAAAVPDAAAGSATPARTDRPRLHALVTDVGNDLLYGFSVEQVAAWLRECVGRLADRGARIAVTRLPLASIASVGRVRYRAMRTLFVPGCLLSLDQVKDAALRLDAELAGIAVAHGAAVIDQPGEWYGLDAIHVRRRRLSEVWERACSVWGLEPGPPPRRSLARWAAVGSRGAEVRSLAGAVRFTRQPVLELTRGGTLSLY